MESAACQKICYIAIVGFDCFEFFCSGKFLGVEGFHDRLHVFIQLICVSARSSARTVSAPVGQNRAHMPQPLPRLCTLRDTRLRSGCRRCCGCARQGIAARRRAGERCVSVRTARYMFACSACRIPLILGLPPFCVLVWVCFTVPTNSIRLARPGLRRLRENLGRGVIGR